MTEKTHYSQQMQHYCQQLSQALMPLLGDSVTQLDEVAHERLVSKPHGDLPRWLAALDQLPVPQEAELLCGLDRITLQADFNPQQHEHLLEGLRGLIPWRKGPFQFGDVHVDTEWRSDWKWQRVLPHLSSLEGRRVLDVGCGSGYHCWRMYGEGARFVLGIDPGILFLVQFLAVKKYNPDAPVWFAPLRMEQMPASMRCFDTVFSMGVLYHRKSPLAHLEELYAALRPGGELVLETLVVQGGEQTLLMPRDRYASMRNVYFLPSASMLELWLQRSGYEQVRIVDENVTTLEEQRATEWMKFHSLPQFLDPQDNSRTIEGYPAPRRAVLLAKRPEE